MTTIHKYQLGGPSHVPIEITMPKLATVLDAQIQSNVITIWAMLRPGGEDSVRRFMVVGTGWNLPDGEPFNWRHISTIQHEGFVWHVFEMFS